jgi:hypothetical protein
MVIAAVAQPALAGHGFFRKAQPVQGRPVRNGSQTAQKGRRIAIAIR